MGDAGRSGGSIWRCISVQCVFCLPKAQAFIFSNLHPAGLGQRCDYCLDFWVGACCGRSEVVKPWRAECSMRGANPINVLSELRWLRGFFRLQST